MTMPPGLQTGTVSWMLTEPSGQPATGMVVFRAAVEGPLQHVPTEGDVAGATILPKVTPIELIGGRIVDYPLVANNDPEINPRDWQYEVTWDLENGEFGSFYFTLLAGQSIDLAKILPVADPQTGVLYVKGEKGDIGPQGESIKGDKGDPGLAATLNFSDTVTIPAGQFAGAENLGTETAAVLKLYVPQGVKGDQGDQGIQGIQGIQGVKGDPGDLTPAASAFATGAISFTSLPATSRRSLTGNVTAITLPTSAQGAAAGVSGTVTIIFIQAATGGPYTVTGWPTFVEWAGDAPAPTMPSAANAELIVHLFWTGATWRGMVGGVFFP